MHDAKTTLLFIGDSITDCGRGATEDGLGRGYVRDIAAIMAEQSPGAAVINRGISGNRIRDLVARWTPDAIALAPDVLTVYIGINDVWREFDQNDPLDQQAFARDYADILTQAKDALSARLILIEPYVLPTTPDRLAWRPQLDGVLATVRRMAAQFGAALVPLDSIFTDAATRTDMTSLTADGVHPTPEGHRMIADAWLTAYKSITGKGG